MKVRIVLLAVLVLVFGLASAIQAQPNLEDFETGDFSSLPWSVSYWRVTSEEAYSGSYSVAAYSTSTGVLEVTLTTGAGQISFWRYSDDNGWLKFYIDGVLTDNWSSLSSTWIQESFPVSAGTHTLRWEASSSGNDDNDVYIDDITFPQTGAEPSAGMALIPAGSFQMGDSFNEGDSDELPVHTVTVSAFYMDKYEVTKALWDEVAEWAAANGYDIGPEDGSTDRSDGSGKAGRASGNVCLVVRGGEVGQCAKREGGADAVLHGGRERLSHGPERARLQLGCERLPAADGGGVGEGGAGRIGW